MVKHTQTIRRLLPKNCLCVFDHFEGLALKQLRTNEDNNQQRLWVLPVFTCSNLTMKAPEQYVKYVQSQQWKDQNNFSEVILSLMLTLNKFHTLFWCFHC